MKSGASRPGWPCRSALRLTDHVRRQLVCNCCDVPAKCRYAAAAHFGAVPATHCLGWYPYSARNVLTDACAELDA